MCSVLPYDDLRAHSAVQTPRLKLANLAIWFRCERTMTDCKFIHFNDSPSQRQQMTVSHLFGQYMTCGADCTTVGRDQTHWLSVLSKTEANHSGDLDAPKNQRWCFRV